MRQHLVYIQIYSACSVGIMVYCAIAERDGGMTSWTIPTLTSCLLPLSTFPHPSSSTPLPSPSALVLSSTAAWSSSQRFILCLLPPPLTSPPAVMSSTAPRSPSSLTSCLSARAYMTPICRDLHDQGEGGWPRWVCVCEAGPIGVIGEGRGMGGDVCVFDGAGGWGG